MVKLFGSVVTVETSFLLFSATMAQSLSARGMRLLFLEGLSLTQISVR